MRRLACGLMVAVFALLASVQAQDGIYGSFLVGSKFVNLKSLNDSLNAMGIPIEFTSNQWTFGGEGHVIVAKALVIGGKGIAFFTEEIVPNADPNAPEERVKISGGIGIGYLGYSFFGGSASGIRLIPEVGLGASPFLLQKKTGYIDPDTTRDFRSSMNDDKMVVLGKAGLVIDGCLAFDWYMKFIRLLGIIPGLEIGPMLHAEAGYTFIPGNLPWLRDTDMLDDYDPDMKFDGFYFAVGVGLGISSAKDEK